MHGFFIGGRMADPLTAAEDAIYWSFHAFIDLIWAEWQRRNGMPRPTTPDGTLRGFLSQPLHKIRDFQETTDLGYDYEYTDRLREAFAVSQPPRESRKLLHAGSLRPLFTKALATELQNSFQAQFAMPATFPETTTAIVRLRELKVPTAGSYALHAYVHPKDVRFDEDDAEFVRKYGVGYVTLWRAHRDERVQGHGGHGPQHHPLACTVRFDVTKTLSGSGGGAAGDLVLTLHYIPAPGPTGQLPSDANVVKEVQLKEIELEMYTQP
jgi:tyrosinase